MFQAGRRALVVATLFALVAPLAARADGPFKPGDRVECDWMQNGTFDKGTVVPFDRNDLDQSGRWYRVKLDKDTIPNSTVECMTNRMRTPAAAPAAAPPPAPRDEGASRPRGRAAQAPAPVAAGNPGLRFKPGDRVECDKAQIGVWEKGTVVPFLPGDLDSGSGRYYRVRLDGHELYAAGHECMAAFVRPLAGGNSLSARAPYRVGDRVEARNANNTWLPATIVAVEGGFYRVRFEGRDSRFDEAVDAQRLRAAGTLEREAAEQRKRDAERTAPPAAGAPPRSLEGTAWKIDFGRGVTGAVFLFCRTGTWHNVLPGGTIGAVGKSYQVAGDTLTTVNRDDGMVQKWRMSWQGDVLELFDGRQKLGLHYNGETQCR